MPITAREARALPNPKSENNRDRKSEGGVGKTTTAVT